MFDFWDIATSALKGGLQAFLGGNKSSSGYTDNSNFSSNDQKKGIPKAGKAQAAPITEGRSFNKGKGMDKEFDPNFEWKGAPFNSQLSRFLDMKDDD